MTYPKGPMRAAGNAEIEAARQQTRAALNVWPDDLARDLDTVQASSDALEVMAASECACGYDGDFEACINGTVYAPCGDDQCGGVCSDYGKCVCGCHKEPA